VTPGALHRGPEATATLDLAEVVCDALRLRIDAWNERGITVLVAPDLSTPAVTGRWAQITQAILYVLDHAAASLAGSNAPHIEIRTWAEHGTGFVEAADNGCGMSPDAVRRFRKPFIVMRREAAPEVGLTLARFIAEAHRGGLTVSSIEGVGTSYRLSLPVGGQPSDVEEGDASPRLTHQRVLLVAPDPWAARVLRRAIELGGGECQAVPSLAHASGPLRAGAFDVVLCDVHGESEERTLVEDLTRQAPAVIARTILLTTRALRPHHVPNDPQPRVLAKPFGIADLVAEIHAIGGHPGTSPRP
jgi:CheY-like chemotaxis protein